MHTSFDEAPAHSSKLNKGVHVGLSAVIISVTDDVAQALIVTSTEGEDRLPSGLFDPQNDRTLHLGLRRWIQEHTHLTVGYVEQLYTFGNRYRDLREHQLGDRFLSIGYLGLTREQPLQPTVCAKWNNIYHYLPWEDWRAGKPKVIDTLILPELGEWVEEAQTDSERQHRSTRVMMTFGHEEGIYDHERVLQRFELMYEVGLLPESYRDFELLRGTEDLSIFSRDLSRLQLLSQQIHKNDGCLMGIDHRRILASALGRIRGKIKYRPLVFELLPQEFTLLKLQKVVEALSGVSLHKQNFRRLIQNERLVEDTGKRTSSLRGRPAALFRFRSQVFAERPSPGVGLPKIGGFSKKRST